MFRLCPKSLSTFLPKHIVRIGINFLFLYLQVLLCGQLEFLLYIYSCFLYHHLFLSQRQKISEVGYLFDPVNIGRRHYPLSVHFRICGCIFHSMDSINITPYIITYRTANSCISVRIWKYYWKMFIFRNFAKAHRIYTLNEFTVSNDAELTSFTEPSFNETFFQTDHWQ